MFSIRGPLGGAIPRGFVGFAVSFAVILAAVVSIDGCGGNSTPSSAFSDQRCQVGRSPVLRRRRLPLWVREKGLGTAPVVVGCLNLRTSGAMEVVGFGNVGPSACVTIEDLTRREAHGEVCTESDETPVGEWCKNKRSAGCITGYVNGDGFTEFSGPLRPKVRSVRVMARGRAVSSDAGTIQVAASVARRIQSPRAFGFFVATLPGCVPSRAVKVDLIGRDGASLGFADPWRPPLGCHTS